MLKSIGFIIVFVYQNIPFQWFYKVFFDFGRATGPVSPGVARPASLWSRGGWSSVAVIPSGAVHPSARLPQLKPIQAQAEASRTQVEPEPTQAEPEPSQAEPDQAEQQHTPLFPIFFPEIRTILIISDTAI